MLNFAKIALMRSQGKKVLIISHDKVGAKMAGPGIRYHYMAKTLSEYFDVTIGFFDPTYLPGDKFQRTYGVRSIDAFSFEKGFEDFNIVIAMWLSDSMIDFCNQKNIFTVFDIYAPVPVENLALSLYSGKRVKPENDFEYKQSLSMYRKFFENGDLFLLSNRRQLDFWTGYIFGADQVRLSTYNQRPFYDRFIYAPMGIDAKQKLIHRKNVMRGVIPGIEKGDKILLWTGGIWGWYDGAVLIKALKSMQKQRPDIKLVFLGTKHPNPNVPEMRESKNTRKLAKTLGLLNKTVFFLDGWVPYNDRINYLLEADIAINTHKPSIETEFSHRTRVLDHLLACLPTIGTEGDYLSDEVVAENDLGAIVKPNDQNALKDAILSTLEPSRYKKIKENIKEERLRHDWDKTLLPLIEALKTDLSKLKRLPGSAQLHERFFKKNLRRYTPKTVKKIAIRILRYGK